MGQHRVHRVTPKVLRHLKKARQIAERQRRQRVNRVRRENKDFLTIKETIEKFGLSRATLYRWCRIGILQIPLKHGVRMIRKSQINSLTVKHRAFQKYKYRLKRKK